MKLLPMDSKRVPSLSTQILDLSRISIFGGEVGDKYTLF